MKTILNNIKSSNNTQPFIAPVPVIQKKIKLGASNDKYEIEADRVADKVVGMTDVQVQKKSQNKLVQLKCSKCDEEYTQKKSLAEGMSTEIQKKENASTNGTVVPDNVSSRIYASKGTGQPLDISTQTYMESRFGTDFSNVRIHTNSNASQLSTELNAQAFTVGNDIYFNNGKYNPNSKSGKHLLAHELTHTIQQNSNLKTKSENSSTIKDSIQRKPYWVSYNNKGTLLKGDDIHKELLKPIGLVNNNLFTEAPVPDADLLSAGFDKRGFADLYWANTGNTVGVRFKNHMEPVYMRSGSKILFEGKKGYKHYKNSSPRGMLLEKDYSAKTKARKPKKSKKAILRVGKNSGSPEEIKIGDLKPFAPSMMSDWSDQLKNYSDGFKHVKEQVNEMTKHKNPLIRNLLDPPNTKWNLKPVGRLGEKDVNIPDKYKVGLATGQSSRRIVLKDGTKKYYKINNKKITGKLFLGHNKKTKGVLNYFFIPDSDISPKTLPKNVKKHGDEVTDLLISPLKGNPLQTKLMINRKQSSSKLVSKKSNLSIQAKKKKTYEDSFDKKRLEKWKKDHKRLSSNFKGLKSTSDYKGAHESVKAYEAQNELSKNFTSVKSPNQSKGVKDNIKKVKAIKFFAHKGTIIFGLFRRHFGKLFIKIASAYEKVKEKVSGLAKKKSKGGGGGILGSAVKVVFKLFKFLGKILVTKTFERITTSLRDGISKKLESFVDNLKTEEIDAKVKEVTELQLKLENLGKQKIEEWTKAFFGDQLDKFKKLDKIREKVSKIAKIVSLVRWGARIIACASPPAVGCLWLIGEAAIEWAASKVVETCWFMKKMVKHVINLQFLKEIPNKLGDYIIKLVRGKLPRELKDIFLVKKMTGVSVTSSDFKCNESNDGPYKLSQDRAAIWNELVGDNINGPKVDEKKFKSFLKFANKNGTKKWSRLTEERVKKIAPFLRNSSTKDFSKGANDKDRLKTFPTEIQDFIIGTKKIRKGEKPSKKQKKGTFPSKISLMKDLRSSMVDWSKIPNGDGYVYRNNKKHSFIAARLSKGTRIGAYVKLKKNKSNKFSSVKISSQVICLDPVKELEGFTVNFSKAQEHTFFNASRAGEIVNNGEIFLGFQPLNQ